MPWKEMTLMSQRAEFIQHKPKPQGPISAPVPVAGGAAAQRARMGCGRGMTGGVHFFRLTKKKTISPTAANPEAYTGQPGPEEATGASATVISSTGAGGAPFRSMR